MNQQNPESFTTFYSGILLTLIVFYKLTNKLKKDEINR